MTTAEEWRAQACEAADGCCCKCRARAACDLRPDGCGGGCDECEGFWPRALGHMSIEETARLYGR